MTVKELIVKLEKFADKYGEDTLVVVNRNGRSHPTFNSSVGVFPGFTDKVQLTRKSGYFEYLDKKNPESMVDMDNPNICVLNE